MCLYAAIVFFIIKYDFFYYYNSLTCFIRLLYFIMHDILIHYFATMNLNVIFMT